jgi:hypothetical protein
MPYTIEWEAAGVIKRFTGMVTGPELVASVNEIASHPRFRELKYELSDYLQSEVRAVRISSYQTNPHIRVAIVTHHPDIEQRIYSTIAAKLTLHQTKVFPSITDANLWLGRIGEN